MKTSLISAISVLLLTCDLPAQTISQARQGYSSRLWFNNLGVMGLLAVPDPNDTNSIGYEYPIGSRVEHISGAGLWVGGKLDTARVGTSNQLRLVSVCYEGWSGPMNEFYPGFSAADTIWKVVGRNVSRPGSWEAYWGNAIRRTSFSDNDHYCVYSDNSRSVGGHVPLNLKVIQSSYVWNDSYADAIHIFEYKIVNVGLKQIDSAYAGIFMDGDVGPRVPNYFQRNFTSYLSSQRLAYTHNLIDSGSTPIGVTAVKASRSLDSLRFAFRWFRGANTPATDAGKYELLASGRIDPDEFPALSDTRFVLSFGPFTILPTNNPAHDTLIVAFGIVSGASVSDMALRAARAKNIYITGTLDVRRSDALPTRFELRQNYPNPFNPSTTISYSLATTSRITLKVVDLLGRDVAILVEEVQGAGNRQVTFDSSGLASGVYYVRMTAGNFAATRKMMLLR